MTKTARVTFADREYLLSEKNMGPAGLWRDRLNNSRTMLIFKGLDTAMIQLVTVADKATELVELTDPEGDPVLDEKGKPVKVQRGFGNVDLNQVIDVAKILPVIVNGLSHSIDEIIDMLFDYSPELAADREWIEENAFDREAIAAFCEVVKLCFPFLEILGLLRGQKAQPTSTNLPSQNGASGREAVGHRTKV